MADGASYSSPSESPLMADFDASSAFDFGERDPHPQASATPSASASTTAYPTQNYSFTANIWQPAAGPSSSSATSTSSATFFPASSHQQQQQPLLSSTLSSL